MRLQQVAARTDVGQMRDHNEDAHLVLSEIGVLAVADGMGGLAHGEIASSTAVSTVKAAMSSLEQVVAAVDEEPSSATRIQLAQVLEFLSNLGSQRIQQALGPGVSGTTLVVATVTGGHLMVCNTGDSRAYLYRKGTLRPLTEDHTVAAAQLRAGVITQAEHDASPYQHMLYQALGTQGEVDPDLFSIPVAKDDIVLVCSDGLTGPVSEPRIAAILERHHHDLDGAVDALIEAANDGGGPDNITVALARVEDGEDVADVENLREVLEQARCLADLGDRDHRTLSLYLDFVSADEGEVLDASTGVHVLLAGAAIRDGEALGPGAIFGLRSLAEDERTVPEVQVIEPARVAVLSPENYKRLSLRRPAVAVRVLHGLYSELSRALP